NANDKSPTGASQGKSTVWNKEALVRHYSEFRRLMRTGDAAMTIPVIVGDNKSSQNGSSGDCLTHLTTEKNDVAPRGAQSKRKNPEGERNVQNKSKGIRSAAETAGNS
ncbi:MAG: hypothetical protein ACREBR_01320, partial [bacterium]